MTNENINKRYIAYAKNGVVDKTLGFVDISSFLGNNTDEELLESFNNVEGYTPIIINEQEYNLALNKTQQEINYKKYTKNIEIRSNYENSFGISLRFTWNNIEYKIPLNSLNKSIDNYRYVCFRLKSLMAIFTNKDYLIENYPQQYTMDSICTTPLLAYNSEVKYLKWKQEKINDILILMQEYIDNIDTLYTKDYTNDIDSLIEDNNRYQQSQLYYLQQLSEINDYDAIKNYNVNIDISPKYLDIPSEFIDSVILY